MRRAARPLLYAGVLVVVFGLAKVHAAVRRALRPHRLGPLRLDDRLRRDPLRHRLRLRAARRAPHPARRRVGASVGAAFTRRRGRSRSLQLFVGDALLPRFVVFGAALLLPDWYRICIAAGRRRPARGPRPETGWSWSADPTRSPPSSSSCTATRSGRPRSWPACRSRTPPSDRTGPARSRRCSASSRPTVLVLDRAAQDDRRHRRPGRASCTSGACGSARSAPSTRSGSASSRLRAGAGVAVLRHRRAPPGRLRAGQAARSTCPLAVVGLRGRSRWSLPFVWLGQPRRQPGPALLPPGRGWARAARTFTILKFRTMTPPGRRRARWTSGPPRTTRASPRSGGPAGHPPRRAAAGGQHPPGRPRRGRAPPRAAALRRRAHRQAAVLRRSATSCAPGSPAGPR